MKNNSSSGKLCEIDPKMECDPEELDAALKFTLNSAYIRNLLIRERIAIMQNLQMDCTHVVVHENGEKFYGRLTGDVIKATNLS